MPYLVQDYIHKPLYVITPIFNPVRFKSRYKHYERFAAHVKASGGTLVTVEAAFGERHHALDSGETQHHQALYQHAPTKPTEFHKARTENNHIYVRVRTRDELWIKENLINAAVRFLPPDWGYVAWVDSDTHFVRPNWVGETIHQLQHYKVVQMFTSSRDVGPRYATIGSAKSFMYCYEKGYSVPTKKFDNDYYYYGAARKGPVMWHPGFAWAMRRDAWDDLGGLIDCAILGAGDNHMAHALVGRVQHSFHPRITSAYKRHLFEWQDRAETYIRRNVGYVSGDVVHYWHGRKVDRRYRDRWKILVDNQYNPDIDIKPDWQGIHQLCDRGTNRSRKLRDQLREYFRARNEDSIDLDGVADFN